MVKRGSFEKAGQRLLPSIAYGDAAGLPVETRSYDYIQQKYGYVDRLMPVNDNSYVLLEFAEGTTSDDTQLSIAVARSLMKAKGFDLRSMADEHVQAYYETPRDTTPKGRVLSRFWGGSTTESVQNIIGGVSPTQSGSKEGTGNGVLMKMAPLVYWQVSEGLEHRNRYNQYDELTSMTHDNDVSRISTRVHGDVLTHLLNEKELYHPWSFADTMVNIAEYHEKWFRSTWDISNALIDLRHLVHSRDMIGEVKGWYDDRKKDLSDEKFGKSYGFYAPETLALAYAAFLHGTLDYEKTIYTAVNLGGDADSVASIAGSMFNYAWLGEYDMPADADKIQDMDKLEEFSHKFGAEAMKVYTGYSPW